MNCVNTLLDPMQTKSDDSLRSNSEIINFVVDLFSSCDDIKILPTEGSSNKSILIGVNTLLDKCSGGILCLKYFTACLHQAIPRLKESHRPIIIALPFVDQSGSTGAKDIIQYMKDRSIHPDLCIQGEPTSFPFITSNICSITSLYNEQMAAAI